MSPIRPLTDMPLVLTNVYFLEGSKQLRGYAAASSNRRSSRGDLPVLRHAEINPLIESSSCTRSTNNLPEMWWPVTWQRRTSYSEHHQTTPAPNTVFPRKCKYGHYARALVRRRAKCLAIQPDAGKDLDIVPDARIAWGVLYHGRSFARDFEPCPTKACQIKRSGVCGQPYGPEHELPRDAG
jgi:hypothetical protein